MRLSAMARRAAIGTQGKAWRGFLQTGIAPKSGGAVTSLAEVS